MIGLNVMLEVWFILHLFPALLADPNLPLDRVHSRGEEILRQGLEQIYGENNLYLSDHFLAR